MNWKQILTHPLNADFILVKSRTTKMRFIRVITCVIFLFIQWSSAARILAVVSIPSYSHQLAYRPLWKELSLRGHQVVLMTTDIINDPTLTNLTEIDMHGSYEILSKTDFNDIFTLSEHFAPMTMMRAMLKFANTLEHYQYSLEQVQDVIKTGKFDLVIGEFLDPSSVVFGEKFDCPVIAVTSMDAHIVLHEAMGDPTHPLLYPVQDIAITNPSTFQQRLFHFIFRFVFKYYFSRTLPEIQSDLAKYFGRTLPPFEEMMQRIKLTFINANPVFYPTRPLSPATVNIAGLHILKAKPLPQDLQNFLDNAEEGVIYVSFGTNVHKKQLSGNRIVETFLETFRELPYKILWKLDGDNSKMNSEKMLVRKWFPQRDVLAHQNVRLFITQGGLQSVEEALHCHVPIIGIPFLGDQFNNVLRAQDNGIGLVIYRDDLNKDTLKDAVLRIFGNPSFKKRVTELAEITEDTPLSPLEKAVWWTEFVLRHRDLSHLKGTAVRATLNELYMIDVVAFLISIPFVAFSLILLVIRYIRRISRTQTNKNKTKKNL